MSVFTLHLMPDSHSSYSRLRLISGASLNNADWRRINLCRGAHNRLGFAYQIAFVRLMGRFPKQDPLEIEETILNFAALQFDLCSQTIDRYKTRRQTISEHQQRIRTYLGLRLFNETAEQELSAYIAQEALRLDRLASLTVKAHQWLETHRFLMPADYAIRRIAQAERRKARETLCEHMMQQLSPTMRAPRT